MTRLWSASLKARLVLLLAIGPLLLAGPLLLYLQLGVNRQSRSWFESRSLAIARLVAGTTRAAVDFDDPQSAAEALSQLSTVPSAEFAVLLRDDGRPLASWREGTPPPGWAPPREAVAYGEHQAFVHVPVVTRAGGSASLVVGFGLQLLEDRVGEVRALLLGSVVFLVGLAAAVLLAVSRLVVQPLDRVTAVARRIAAGDDSAHADLERERGDELGTLARAFDVMLRRLFQQREELTQREEAIRALNAGLEERVAERTAALEEANTELSQRLTELRSAQEQLVVADRRVSIGRIAAGVAHEINNPLAYVSGNLAYLSEGLAEAQEALRRGEGADLAELGRTLTRLMPAAAEAQQGATRVHRIVRGLKAFSHGDEDLRAPVDVVAALTVAIEMAQHEIKHRARLETSFGAVSKVDASEVRLTQVFLNLLVNAAQALGEGKSEQSRIGVSVRQGPDRRVVVEVSDTGCGIGPEVRARLFEPFFTTKPVGQGNGLGLAISQGIIASYGGVIQVESEPGKGSTFRVSLPPSQLAAPATAAPTPAQAAVGGPRRRLLVIDDEPAVGTVLARLLGRDHDVVTVAHARAALELLARGERFDRILCDLEMPGMNGADFRAAAEQLAPGTVGRVVFMTGGAFTEASRRIWEQERDRVIEKPVDVTRLRELLAEG